MCQVRDHTFFLVERSFIWVYDVGTGSEVGKSGETQPEEGAYCMSKQKWKYRWRFIRLPYKLLLVYMPLILLPALAGIYYLTDSYTTSSKARTFEYATDLLSLMGQKIDERLYNYERLSKQIMTDPELLQMIAKKPSTTYEIYELQNTINEKLNSFWLGADQSMYVRAIKVDTYDNLYTYGKNALDDYSVTDPAYREKVSAMRGAAIWFDPVTFSDGSGSFEALRLGRSIRDHKLKELGALTIIIEVGAITDLFDLTNLRDTTSLKLLDRNGKLLLDNGKDLPPDEQQLLTYSQDDIHNGWRLSAELSLNEMYEPIHRTARTAIFLIAACIILGLVVTHLLAMDLVFPIRRLMMNMKQGVRGVTPNRLKRFGGAIEIVEMNDTFISVMYEIEQLIERIGKQEKKKKDAEIRVLQNQLSPHFLFNTLNSIRWMAIIQKQDNIKGMVDSLNQLLIYALRGKGDDVTLETEMGMLHNYAAIQKVRYQHFEYQTHISTELFAARMPKFLLQPIIENALIHGLAQADRPGEIIIIAERQGNHLLLTVQDNGIGIDPEKQKLLNNSLGKGDHDQHFGVYSVHERIQLHYGPQYGLQIASELGKGTKVTVTIPFITDTDHVDGEENEDA